MTASLYDLQYTTPGASDNLHQRLLQLIKRRKSVSPNPADGFQTTSTKADSDAEGAGDATTAPGATSGQN